MVVSGQSTALMMPFAVPSIRVMPMVNPMLSDPAFVRPKDE